VKGVARRLGLPGFLGGSDGPGISPYLATSPTARIRANVGHDNRVTSGIRSKERARIVSDVD